MSEKHELDSLSVTNGVSDDQETESVSGVSNVESKEEMFVDANEDQFQETETENGWQYDDDEEQVEDAGSVVRGLKVGRFDFSAAIINLKLKLKALAKESAVGDEDEAVMSGENEVRDMITECSRLVEVVSEERECNERTIRELEAQIEELPGKVQVEQNAVESAADRMIAALGTVVTLEELVDCSVTGKIARVEQSSLLLIEQYRWILYEMEQLRNCLTEAGSNMVAQEEYGFFSVLPTARGELIELKRKEVEMLEKFSGLEDENKKLVGYLNSELENTKAELDQEKHRCANAKEKLSMAVTKGKALVQQRDSLKQSLAEKASEIEKCLLEKSNAIEASEACKAELTKCEGLLASLQETLSQKNVILETFEEIISQIIVPEELQSVDAVGRLRWLVNMVSSLQKKASENNTILEELLLQTNVPEELKLADNGERLKWLVNLVGSLQEMLSERVDVLNQIESVFCQISAPEELQSADTINKLNWLVEERNAVQDNLLEFHKLKDALSSFEIPQTILSSDLETRLDWLKNSAKDAKDEIGRLQDDFARIGEAANNEMDRLKAALLAELQENEFIKMELDDLASKYEEVIEKELQASAEKDQIMRMLLEGYGTLSGNLEGASQIDSDPTVLISRCLGKIKEQSADTSVTFYVAAESFQKVQSLFYIKDQELMLCKELLEEDILIRSEVNKLSNELRTASLVLSSLKEERETLQKDLERSEEKSALVREKLSLAVKKGKGLVQDRENLKLLLEEKNSEIEKLKLELQKQQSTVTECRYQINNLSAELEQTTKLEADFIAMKEQRDQLQQLLLDSKNMYQSVIESVDHIVLPVESVFEEPVQKINWLAGFIDECQQAKTEVQQEMGKVKNEMNVLSNTLAEAHQSLKSLEDSLSFSENQFFQLTDEKKVLEAAKEKLEQELESAREEAIAEHDKLAEAWEARKSLEDSWSLAESNIFMLVKEREEAQVGKATAESELEKVQGEVAGQTSKLTEAYENVKSLKDELSRAEANISSLTELNNHTQAGSSNLESEVMKLKVEVDSWTSKVADASTTIKLLEEQLSKAVNDVSALEDEKKIAEHEISTLNSKLKACMDGPAETTGSLESRSMELLNRLSDLQVSMIDESLLSTVRKHFEKEFQNLKDMDIVLDNMRVHLSVAGSDFVPNHALMKEDCHVTRPFPSGFGNVETEINNDEPNTGDVDSVSLYLKKTADEFQLRKKILADNFEGFPGFIHEIIEALLAKFRTTKDVMMITFDRIESMKQEMRMMEMQRDEQEKTIANLQNSNDAAASTIKDLQKKLRENGEASEKAIGVKALIQNRASELEAEVGSLQSSCKEMMLKLEDYQDLENKLQEKEAELSDFHAKVGILQNKLRENEETSEKATEEKARIQDRVCELEADVESMQTSCKEMRLRIEDYLAMEGEFHEKEAELSHLRVTIEDLQNKLERKKETSEKHIESMQTSCKEMRFKLEDYHSLKDKLQEKEAELLDFRDQLLKREKEVEESPKSTSQFKLVFEKLRSLDIPLAEMEMADGEPDSSTDVKKLFYIIDSVTELQNQIRVLSHEKDELQSNLSTRVLEIEQMEEEIATGVKNKFKLEKLEDEISEVSSGLQKICHVLGSNEIVGDHKPYSLLKFLPALEKNITALLLEAESSKSQSEELHTKLLGSQRVIDELSTRIKLLEDSLQSRNTEIVLERSIFEAPALPSGSEISEIEDVGPSATKTIPPAPAAAHALTTRKGLSDHLALDVDLESAGLINTEQRDEDKGRMFKSLNTSGLIPKQGKPIADRIDGIWVSSSGVLMNRPRARLGLIAYWLVLHIWFLGTIL